MTVGRKTTIALVPLTVIGNPATMVTKYGREVRDV
jgi:hypothetical protein